MGRSKNTKVNKGNDNEAALAALHAQGQAFLQSFALPAGLGKKRKLAEEIGTRSNKKGKGKEKEVLLATESDDDEGTDVDADVDEEDWTDGEDVSDEEEEEGQDTSDNNSLADNTPGTSTSERKPTVVVFSQPATNTNNNPLHPKLFMSSKISKVTQSTDGRASTKTKTDEEVEEDRSNFKNDAELHKLLHTKLLSGSLNPDLGLTSAQRRKALEGRVLELASGARLGKGESVVRQSEKNKASKRVRDGLNAKKVEREKKELDEAKNLGNYHPTLKKLFAASGSTSNGGKRERGLKLGVGKFTGGMLKLSREEIGSVEGRSRGGRGGGRGRGGGGRGRGRSHGSKRGRH